MPIWLFLNGHLVAIAAPLSLLLKFGYYTFSTLIPFLLDKRYNIWAYSSITEVKLLSLTPEKLTDMTDKIMLGTALFGC